MPAAGERAVELGHHRLVEHDVAGVLADVAGEHDLVLVGDRLGVVALHPAVRGVHDAAVGIGHVDLRDGAGAVLGGVLGGGEGASARCSARSGPGSKPPSRRPARVGGRDLGRPLGLLGLRAGQRGLVVGLRPGQRGRRAAWACVRSACVRPRGRRRPALRLACAAAGRGRFLGLDHGQRGLQAPEPPARRGSARRRRSRSSARQRDRRRSAGVARRRQQLGDLAPDPGRVAVAIERRVGRHLGAVQRHHRQIHQPRRRAQPQPRHEQARQAPRS